MTSATLAVGRWLPFLRWLPAVRERATLRADLEAGLIGAVLILPQAIALASLAGMPPEYGIYASIFPVIVAALFGSSYHALSGPNTAVCVLIAASVAPFASPATDAYIGYVLALTLMAGLIQFGFGLLGRGGLLDFVSPTVISAIVLAVALIIIVSSGAGLLGVLANAEESFAVRLYQLVHDVPRANLHAVAVGGMTVLTGLVARRFLRRYALVLAVFAGSLVAVGLNLALGPATTELELLGHLSLSLLPFSVPQVNNDSMQVLKGLLVSAFSIAFLGILQTVVIARALAAKSGQYVNTNQEIIGQGLANIVAPFLTSFAGSGSFNRSAAHYAAGARTPMAAVYASLLLGAIVLAAAPLIAYMPMAAVAGALILVGIGLIDTAEIRRVLGSRHEALVFVLTFAAALAFGLNAAVFAGLLASAAIYLRSSAAPRVTVEEHSASDGRTVQAVAIEGSLFFGAVRHVERALAALDAARPAGTILLLRTDKLSYVDVPGAATLVAALQRWRQRGEAAYVYVEREPARATLTRAGLARAGGDECMILRDRGHAMKDILWPAAVASAPSASTPALSEENTMQNLAQRLKATKLFAPLSVEALAALLAAAESRHARAGELVLDGRAPMQHHLVLLAGELVASRRWTGADGVEHTHRRTIRASDDSHGLLSAASRGLEVRALTAADCLFVDADRVDELLGWMQKLAQPAGGDSHFAERARLVKQVSVFRQLPPESLRAVFEGMRPRPVQAGETVVRQGEPGDCYYLIESGEAEVWRQDALSDETVRAASLGPGDAFGEEALLQGGFRNATVRMTTPGLLLVLAKNDFDALVRPSLVEEIAAEPAQALVREGKARWLDCRYDMEYEESRLPNAQLITLDHLREEMHRLDPDATYVVYCRSGRRSVAAAFLLRERNIRALSLIGGIRDWPYAVDSAPIGAG